MIVKTYSVFCDGDSPQCRGWIVQTTEGIGAARREAREAGWAFMGHGKDLCPICRVQK